MVKEHVLQTETATMQSSVLARRVDAAWWCRAAEEPEELDHGIRPRMRCISGVRVVDGQFGTSGMQGATFQLLQSGNVVNLPLKRKSCKMEVTKQHRLGRRWGRGILHCRSSRGLKAWFDQESEVSRTKLTRRKSLVLQWRFPVGRPGSFHSWVPAPSLQGHWQQQVGNPHVLCSEMHNRYVPSCGPK